jgi:EmrB/QacA subfamily drug resistance transporter
MGNVSRPHLINAVGAETGAVEPTVAPAVERPRDVAPPANPHWTANLIPLAVASALFMEFIDSTALSTALPTLAHAFHSDPVHLKMALTSYLLALAVCAPASGWVADRYGARRVFLCAMAVFLVGSSLCGFSRSLDQLVAARILQGLGGAMMTPVGRLIVVGSAPRDRFVSAMSWFTMPAMVGPLLGPPLAGLVLGVADWPWIFFINIPVGILGMIAVGRFVPKLESRTVGRFDTSGFFMSAVSITGIVFVSETAGVGLVSWPVELAAALLCGIASVAFLRHVRRKVHPVLELDLLRIMTFRASTIGGSLVRLGLGATPLLLPLLLQIGLGWSPVKAGLVTISQSFGALMFKPVAPMVIRRLGYRNVLVASAVATGVTVAIPAAFNASTPLVAMVVLLGVSGFVRSMHFTSSNALAYADVSRDRVSQASTLSTVVQQVSMSLGVSFGGLVLHLARGHDGALTPDHFVIPFLAVGFTALLAAPFYMRLHPDAGAEIGGRAAAPAQ